MTFPFFIEKKAPISGEKSLMEYRCSYIGEANEKGKKFLVGVQAPITTVCPCSREISARGAHNQRGVVTVRLLFKKFFWIEDIIALIEDCASADVYALLKREDEKALTERAYDNPMFVEDVVREIAVRLNKDPNFPWFSVEAENFESIHNHSAYAFYEKKTFEDR
jgi:GTP cyclohydrolase I